MFACFHVWDGLHNVMDILLSSLLDFNVCHARQLGTLRYTRTSQANKWLYGLLDCLIVTPFINYVDQGLFRTFPDVSVPR